MLGGKEKYTLYDKEIILNGGEPKLKYIEHYNVQKEFRNQIRCVKKEDYPFLYNFIDLLDDGDFYIDKSHVNEEGNAIVADRIYDIVEEKGLL